VLGTAPCQYCMGTRVFRTCRDNVCMQSITTESIRRGWQRLKDRMAGVLRKDGEET